MMEMVRKFFKVFFIAVGLLVGFLTYITIVTIWADDTELVTTTTTEEPKKESKKEPKKEPKKESKKEETKVKTVGIGEKATIENVSFTVSKVEEKSTLTATYRDPLTTSGKFVLIDVKIDNAKKEALSINDSYFEIKKPDGTTFESSSDTWMYVDPDSEFFLTQINPGLSKSGTVAFEVPKHLDLSKATLQCQTGYWGTESIEISLK